MPDVLLRGGLDNQQRLHEEEHGPLLKYLVGPKLSGTHIKRQIVCGPDFNAEHSLKRAVLHHLGRHTEHKHRQHHGGKSAVRGRPRHLNHPGQQRGLPKHSGDPERGYSKQLIRDLTAGHAGRGVLHIRPALHEHFHEQLHTLRQLDAAHLGHPDPRFLKRHPDTVFAERGTNHELFDLKRDLALHLQRPAPDLQ